LVGTDAKVYGWLASVSPDRVLDFVTRKLMR
jgi:hypothetical protein